MIGWTSPYLAQLTREDSELYITEDEAAWVVSLLPFGRLFGAVIGSIIMEYYGSKRALLATGVPVMVGWICVIFANSAYWLYTSRICSGIALGMFFSCFAIYIGEIATAKIRGALVSMIINGMPVGTLLGNIMGSQTSMMCFGIISLTLNICYVTIFPFLPQSPHYHVRLNNENEAKKSIQWYNRKSDVKAELELIEDFVKSTESRSFRDKIKQILERKNRRVFTMILLLFVFMQLSGLNTVTFYMEIIVRSAQVKTIEPSTVVIISSGFGIAVGWISVYLIDLCGRKVLMVVSCSCVVMSMVILGLHFMLLDLDFDPESLEWLPILGMILFMLMSIGLVPVPRIQRECHVCDIRVHQQQNLPAVDQSHDREVRFLDIRDYDDGLSRVRGGSDTGN
ncbi:Facilitated trehalose transporter Tret1 [Habropoda laboriosa]|uniref:Facilitated trehalose transporter Tret1 n=1 Tax=Habropoda laboriosa TaxID=597456 RepID=A0A0L7QZR5_9HYME|nr:Facilitated trehalose transporter Tret1 [Habropoda laboriosa]